MLYTVISILLIVFYIWALYDLFTSKKKMDKKIIWAIIILVIPFLGTIIYYFIGRK